ncbi:MAG: endonuclease III [Ruminococcus sp.]|jgi:endonuclease-3|nr:endonuclease III [Ruminococcus sp.]
MKMNKKIELIISMLEDLYPDAKCSLLYEKPYELLFATRLSAQCTDSRVNIVTKVLFEKYKNLEDYAKANIKDLEEIVKSCGFYKTKAQNIKDCALILLSEYGGELPDSIENLTKLPGIGRKTANLIMGDIFGKPAVVTDTHCIRICGRLGLTKNKDPHKVEIDLRKILPPEKSSDFCHRLVMFGREYCRARNPRCNMCPLQDDICANPVVV